MPSGLKRLHHSGQSHFVTFTCYHRFPHLADDKTCLAFVVALERARKLYQLVERAEDWKWGSFRHYALHEECGVEIESQWTADKRTAEGV